MVRPRRSFKLRLSPAGMDLLIDSHCHLIRSTRRLLAWGTTLHVAVAHLDAMPTGFVGQRLKFVLDAGLSGPEEHHVGASQDLAQLAMAIAQRVRVDLPQAALPSLGSIYLLALHELVLAEQDALRKVYDEMAR